jgi:hypothetical protein
MENPINDFLCSIEETNAIFNKSNKSQQRIMIVEDCLKRIKLQMLTPSKQRFLKVPDSLKDLDNIIVNKLFLNTNNCQVCAKGALFASFVGRVNNFESGLHFGNDTDDEAHIKLSNIFTHRQLSMIEMAFEGGKYLNYDLKGKPITFGLELSKKLYAFYYTYDNDIERLERICCNIIENNGTFKL